MSTLPTTPAVVAGRFEVVRTLQDAGDTQVLLARDRELDLDVVLKACVVVDGDDLSRLRREAALLMRVVAHPGLPVVRSDLVDGDRYYLISDYVAGNDLEATVTAQGSAGLAVSTVLDLIDQVAGTLDHLHRHRPAIIHGDVKPENLILDPNGRLVLVDLGAAIRVGGGSERLGTPGFSAPEVLAGETVSPASDVYSLAALTVYLFTGIVPKLGSAWSAALAHSHLARLEGALRRGLTWDPLGRPWSASDFASRLREAAEMDVPTGTVTLLLADSTAPLVGLDAVGGSLMNVASLSPKTSLVVFSRAGDAASVALDLVTPGQPPIALHAGDLGGWHGATLEQLVVEADALRSEADPATIICSPPVRMLLGGDQALDFGPLPNGFALRLATNTTPAASSKTVGSGLEPSGRRAEPWITSRRSSSIAGRQAELQTAAEAIERCRNAGQAAMIVAVGEAGMGKTRLVAEIAASALDRGEHVMVGRCSESGGAFEPFLDAFGHEFFPFEKGPVELDEEGWMDRSRFFADIAESLHGLSGPITIVIDDIQWIDGSSLALLAQLLDDLAGKLVVLAGCRSTVDQSVLDELTRRLETTRIAVGPLKSAAIASMAELLGVAVGVKTVDDLYALTGGNPFFVSQLLTHVRDVPDQTLSGTELPAGVREWILRRVDRLGADMSAMLAPAAVIGHEFEVVTLAAVLEMSPLEVLSSLDAAANAGLLVDGEHPGEFQFVHSLVGAALTDSLSPARQALLHAAIGQRIEEQSSELVNLEQAMHHWFQADRLGDPLHAAELAVEVATRTIERLAHEQAITVLDRALAVLPNAAAGNERDGVEAKLRVAHGRADLFASHTDEAMSQLYRAADLADGADEAATLAEAALLGSLTRRHGLDDPNLLRLLERATARCPAEPAVLPAMLHIRRARLLPRTVPHEERTSMARLGLRDLDRMDAIDRATVETEVSRACWGPDDAVSRVAVATRNIEEATRHLAGGGQSRWTGVLIESLNHRSAARVQLGLITEALDDAKRGTSVAADGGTTFLCTRLMMAQAMIQVVLGKHEEAERLSHDAVAMSDRHNLLLANMSIAYAIARDRGQPMDLSGVERQVDDLIGHNSLFVVAIALAHAEAERLDDARRLLAAFAESAPWPRNWVWLATVVAGLEASILTGDQTAVRRYSAVLKRYSGLWAVGGGEGACFGPVDRVLGLAEVALGRPDEARRFLTAAADASSREKAEPWLRRSRSALESLDLS